MKTTAIAWMFFLTATAAVASDADVVAAAYPQRLIVDFIQNIQEGPDGPVRFSNFARSTRITAISTS